MSKVSISGDQNGTGNFTIKAPNSNSDRTLTIPDSDGEFLFTDSNGDLSVDGDIKITATNARFNAGIDGSATNPTFIVNDGDTGLFRAGNNSLGFTTGGSEAARIDSDGNVGIGTSSPKTPLDVSGRVSADGYGKGYSFGTSNINADKYLLFDAPFEFPGSGFGDLLHFYHTSFTNGAFGTVALFRVYNSTSARVSFSNVLEYSGNVSAVRVEYQGEDYLGLRFTSINASGVIAYQLTGSPTLFTLNSDDHSLTLKETYANA